MEIYLAGYNIDIETLHEIAEGNANLQNATPETISAAYARISRNPKPVCELRKIARKEIEKARASNRRIIFDMGHHSVAEHAAFNFDIIGVSRLAIEEIEHFRLCSFTEKSQRYIKLHGNHVVPEEIEDTGLTDEFVRCVKKQNRLYQELFNGLKEKARNQAASADKKELKETEIRIKEDVRYITCLATQGQLGMTVNARNLELMIRRFAAHPLREVRELGEKLYRLVLPVAPSIMLFPEATEFDQETMPALKQYAGKLFENDSPADKDSSGDAVELLFYTPDADELLMAALLHTASGKSFRTCRNKAREMPESEKLELMKCATGNMQFYDTVLREFEYVNVIFELTVSASCFAQLKRHRMATITVQQYNPMLGITIPRSIREYGGEKEFLSMIRETEDVYNRIARSNPLAASYILTNAHRRRVIMQMNARELYHFSRLREDKHAQWEIRETAGLMLEKVKNFMPFTLLLSCGKDRYSDVFEQVFGRRPRFDVPAE